jgi:DNA repair protein RadC
MNPGQITMFGKPRLSLLSERERPDYRVARDPRGCTTLELLAALLGGDTQLEIAEALLGRFEDLKGLLAASPEEIAGIRGIGAVKASRIKAALELGRQAAFPFPDRATIQHPADAASLVASSLSGLDHEELWVILMDTRNQVIKIQELYRGNVNSSSVRVGELFQEAVRIKAKAIIPVHNHPSGDPTPSPDDVAITHAFVQAGKLLDIEVLDHLCIGNGRFVSLKERGLGFT